MGRKMTTPLDRGAEIAYTCGLKTEEVTMSNERTLRVQSLR